MKSLTDIRIASPCSVDWERMTGDDRARYCDQCNLHVYNLSELTEPQILSLVEKTEERICAKLYRRFDGTMITSDCPVGIRTVRRHVSRIASAAFAAIVSLCSVAIGQTTSKAGDSCNTIPQTKITKSVSKGKEDVFAGVVKDLNCALVPGADVWLTNNRSKEVFTSKTTKSGEFKFSITQAGMYTFQIKASGFVTQTINDIEIHSGEVTSAVVILDTRYKTMGIMSLDVAPASSTNGITVFDSKMIQSLPLSK